MLRTLQKRHEMQEPAKTRDETYKILQIFMFHLFTSTRSERCNPRRPKPEGTRSPEPGVALDTFRGETPWI